MKKTLAILLVSLVSAGVVGATIPAQGFSEVADKVSPAVVGITVTREITVTSPFGYDFDEEEVPPGFEEFFKRWGLDQIPEPQIVPGAGSGVIFDAEGYVITNNHVVDGAQEITVELADGTEYSGQDVELVGTDPETDLAVIKIKAKRDLPTAVFANSDEVKVGDWAIAIGNPYQLDHTVTVGVVSAKGRSNLWLGGKTPFQDFIQTDAAINPGNSGGPLCDINGEVIGINAVLRTNGFTNSGIGFAIPSNLASDIAQELIENGKVSRGYLGVFLQEATPDIREVMDIGEEGVLVTRVVEDTPAERAGLESGDLIYTVDDEQVASVQQLMWIIASHPPGTKVGVDVIRDGKKKEFNVTLGERPPAEEMSMNEETIEETSDDFAFGVSVRDLTTEDKKALNVKQGVLVEMVKPGSIAERAGIMPGDVIESVNKTEVENVKELKRLRSVLENEEIILFQINRRGHTHFLTIRP